MSLVWTILVTCKQIFLPPLVPGHPLSGLWLVRTFKMAHLDHVTPLKSFPAQDNVKKGLGNLASGVLFSLIPKLSLLWPCPLLQGPFTRPLSLFPQAFADSSQPGTLSPFLHLGAPILVSDSHANVLPLQHLSLTITPDPSRIPPTHGGGNAPLAPCCVHPCPFFNCLQAYLILLHFILLHLADTEFLRN